LVALSALYFLGVIESQGFTLSWQMPYFQYSNFLFQKNGDPYTDHRFQYKLLISKKRWSVHRPPFSV